MGTTAEATQLLVPLYEYEFVSQDLWHFGQLYIVICRLGLSMGKLLPQHCLRAAVNDNFIESICFTEL